MGEFREPDDMNIAEEVFIDNEPDTITYEVNNSLWF